jgi:gamma-glutamyltranspeptidase
VQRPAPLAIDAFGGGQAIQRLDNNVLAGASDRRKDGCALAL